jgi:hypothetical protein
MSRLELAAGRLEGALESLEKAVLPLKAEAAEGRVAQGRIAERDAERERLLGRIAALEEELSALSGLTEEVEGRLDGAIGEIRAALAR